MQTIKRQVGAKFILFLAAVTLFAGCGPPGPRALFKGKKLLEQGRYPEAVEKLKLASTLLNTNAQAWNYLGLAYHQAGQPDLAVKAYQHALALDHDLSEAHYNLGCLWLAQNRLDAAKTEFMAYTLRRENSPEGFLKLGEAQCRSREPAAAEKSFNDALKLSPQNPEALTGLGLARLQRLHPEDAVQYFHKALKQQPDYAPALLNLAIVEQEYLKDRPAALQTYHQYLALKPPPEDAESVKAVARDLEQELTGGPPRVATTTPATAPNTNSLAPKLAPSEPARIASQAKTPGTNPARVASVPKTELMPPVSKPVLATNTPKPATPGNPPPAPPASAANVEVVRLSAEPVLKSAEDTPITADETQAVPVVTPSSASAKTTSPKTAKRTFLQRINPLGLLDGEPSASPPVTPLPPMRPAEADSSGFPAGTARYTYRAPAKPRPGNRGDAERAFAQGVQAQQAQRLPEAIQAYRRATQLDPAYFDAYYNLALAAAAMGNLPLALAAYEDALAVRPESLDARYNFALLLKQANFPVDAANELEKLLLAYPNDSRTHLALGNLEAQQLHHPDKARGHYLKVLETDPRNPQAAAIRYWLTDGSR